MDIVITYQTHSLEYIMNIAKNMEVIFVAAIALIGATSLATAAAPHSTVSTIAQAQAAAPAKMQVVTISAKRLSAAEKAGIAQ